MYIPLSNINLRKHQLKYYNFVQSISNYLGFDSYHQVKFGSIWKTEFYTLVMIKIKIFQ